MSKLMEARSQSSASSTELPPLSLATHSDTPASDGDERIPSGSRERTNSLSKPEISSFQRGSKQNRRKSERIESRMRTSTTTESTKPTSSDITDTTSEEASPRRIPYGIVGTPTETTSVDYSILTSTLQSINRIKEEKEVAFEDGVLKGGSITAIVLRLIEDADRQTILAFLIVLPRYGLPEQLLGLLEDKYPLNAFKEHHQEWLETSDPVKEKMITALLNFYAIWLENHFVRDFQRTDCLALSEPFLAEILAAGFVEWHRMCKLIILRRVGHEAKSALFSSPVVDEAKTKKGKRLSNKKRSRANSVADGEASFDTLTAADIAEQLTLREWELFRIIPESEFLQKTWVMRPPPVGSALVNMIDHFNVVSMWVASEIVNTEDLKDRANAVKKFTQVCDLLFELGNFNGLMEVVAGLSLGCVQRLQKTWNLAGSGPKAVYEKFSHIMTTKLNFQSYRHALSATKLPAVPYVGVLLRDLIFLEEGNPLRLPNGFFNFDRIHLLGRLILDIQRFKRISYDIPVLPAVQAFFANLKPLDNDDALWVASTAAENDHPDPLQSPS